MQHFSSYKWFSASFHELKILKKIYYKKNKTDPGLTLIQDNLPLA